MSDVRMPVQKRSIEKRQRIIDKGFELMCNKGFYKTNTIEIGEYAGVSTGIIYQYFNDKKDIFLAGVQDYAAKIMYPMVDILENEKIDTNNLEDIVRKLISSFVKSHTMSKKAHEELLAMSHLDEDVASIFNNNEMMVTDRIVDILNCNNMKVDNIKEKVHIIVGIIDNLCHELVYHRHDEIDYEVMTDEVSDIVVKMLK